jgi:hypothetical protein
VRTSIRRKYHDRIGRPDAASVLENRLRGHIGRSPDAQHARRHRQRAGIMTFGEIADRNLGNDGPAAAKARRPIAERVRETDPTLFVDTGQRDIVEVLQGIDVAEARFDDGRERICLDAQSLRRRLHEFTAPRRLPAKTSLAKSASAAS